MTVIHEGMLEFDFDAGADVAQYDQWTFYRSHFLGVAGETKAVDLLCLAKGVLWFIEVKDYRRNRRTKPSDLANEVAHKVRDTLSGLAAASHFANTESERDFAKNALCKSRTFRVVLHLEQPSRASRLFPRIANPASVQLKLKKCLRQAIDDHPKVLDKSLTQDPRYCWTVASVGR